jgi:hypothetical protein
MRRTLMRRGRIRNELVLGLAAVVIASSLVTYAVVLFAFFRDFDSLLEKNDLTIAALRAALSDHYARRGSWDGAAVAIEEQERLSFARDERRRDEGGWTTIVRRRSIRRTTGFPSSCWTTRDDSSTAFPDPGRRAGPSFGQPSENSRGRAGSVGGKAVGYVFFNRWCSAATIPRTGLRLLPFHLHRRLRRPRPVLALGLGSLLAARFALPISTLDAA